MESVNPQEAAQLETARVLTMEMVVIATNTARDLGYYGVGDQLMISAVINAMASNYLATITKNR